MAGLVYYLPGKGRGIKIDELRAAGLGHAFETLPITPCGVRRGPGDSGEGVVVGDPRAVPEARIGFYPERQQWRPAPRGLLIDGQAWWVGFEPGNRPTPAELQRRRMLDGHPVMLADGQTWLCPIARGLSEQDDGLVWDVRLPQRTTLDDEGNWTRAGVMHQYGELWKIAEQWWDALHGGLADAEDDQGDSGEGDSLRISFDFAGLNEAAVAVLAANYRLSKVEVALLELFNDQCAVEILQALIDWPTKLEFLKKKLTRIAGDAPADGFSSAVGPADAPPDTGPAS